ncbi:uncharacterized protein PAC_14996 [Phialocephala subalpina]|uniref:Deoxyribonuclease NucA/NucB domain-containing protein n=1 Tax=Phialocephala subalpina TaxID=576137 RepID=A0A1L7XJI0_9HELO|nr:uncharacterized protein PAC_14996 [Phialocephala subalpina]
MIFSAATDFIVTDQAISVAPPCQHLVRSATPVVLIPAHLLAMHAVPVERPHVLKEMSVAKPVVQGVGFFVVEERTFLVLTDRLVALRARETARQMEVSVVGKSLAIKENNVAIIETIRHPRAPQKAQYAVEMDTVIREQLVVAMCCSDDDGPYCADECLPTIIFPHLEGFSEEIFENMCKGIAKKGNVLTWDGGRGQAGRRANSRRRRQQVAEVLRFPFASTVEGGAGSQISCVPKDQNDWQGIYWSQWLQEAIANGFTTGSRFRVKISGYDCTSVVPREVRRKRDSTTDPILSSNGNITVFGASTFTNASTMKNAVVISLISDDGNVGTMEAIQMGGSNATAFDIDDEGSGSVFFLGWSATQKVNLNYSVKIPPFSTSTTSSAGTSSAGISPTVSVNSQSSSSSTAKKSEAVSNHMPSVPALMLLIGLMWWIY